MDTGVDRRQQRPDAELRDLFEGHVFGPLRWSAALSGMRARRGGAISVRDEVRAWEQISRATAFADRSEPAPAQ